MPMGKGGVYTVGGTQKIIFASKLTLWYICSMSRNTGTDAHRSQSCAPVQRGRVRGTRKTYCTGSLYVQVARWPHGTRSRIRWAHYQGGHFTTLKLT